MRGANNVIRIQQAFFGEASRVLLSKNLSRPVADLNVEKNVIYSAAVVGARNLSRIFFPSDFVASGASMTPNQTVDRPDRANATNTVSTNVSVSLSTNPRAAF